MTEQKKRVIERKIFIEKCLRCVYSEIDVNGKMCFQDGGKRIFSVFSLLNYEALGVEYAENIEEAYMNRFEDGDLFYLSEMDEESMLRAIFEEIIS